MVKIELRVCGTTYPVWGFSDGVRFYPFGPTEYDKSVAIQSAEEYKKGNKDWKGVPLDRCGPNLDVPN